MLVEVSELVRRSGVNDAWETKVALVSGAGRGIGEAVAVELAARGAAVGVLDVDADVAGHVADSIAATGGKAVPISGDIRQAGDAQRAVDVVVQHYGGLDALVNNAGVQRYGSVEDTPEDEWDLVIDTNLKGAYLLSRFAVPHLRARGGGAIVHTASVQAFASQRAVVAYSASKGGIVAMTRTMALDHAAEGIRVNAIAPGSVRTPMLENAAALFVADDPESAIAEWGAGHPIGRVIEAREVAALVLFLIGDESTAITGATYVIDGGLLAKAGI